MNSRFWRTTLRNFFLGTFLEYALAFCLSLYFNEENYFYYALLILFAIWAAQLVLWIKGLIVGTILYYVVGRRRWIAEIETMLRLREFPVYDDPWPDADEYFSKVIQDKHSTLEQITFSAATLGQIEVLKLVRPTMALRMMSVAEAALDRYRRDPSGSRYSRAARPESHAFR